MRVPVSWLREYVSFDTPIDDLAHRLTLAGVEVGAVERTGDWDKVYVGEITRIEPHPNADRLRLATVNYAIGTLTVVTGAPNIKVGDRVPFALPGAELVDFHQDPPRKAKLRPGKIRGVESAGMVCSAAELGLGDDHAGILVLPPDAPVGTPLAEYLGETVLELELTPNRSDCLALLGVAREVAALTRGAYREPTVEVPTSGRPAADSVRVEIADPDLCRRYSAALVENVRVGPSPKWLRDRLTAAGVRPINNVVDVTNYVMLEYGQPMHAFDFERIGGGRIVVRRARPGERIRTLDGVDRALDSEMLAIADAERPVAVAGVMGGEDGEVSEQTTRVLLESACFNPTSIRKTSRALRLPSEASRRFEKGLPPELTIPALARAAQLLHDLAGGAVAPGWVDAYPEPARPRSVDVPVVEFERLLGVRYAVEEIEEVLSRLGFGVRADGATIHVDVPYRRVDVGIPADVVEEVARVKGYDELPATQLRGAVPPPTPPDAAWRREDQLRDVLVGCGLTEVITYSMTSEARLDKLPIGQGTARLARELEARLMPGVEPLRIVNPLSAEMSVLRTSTFPSMLETIRDNLRWTDRDVRLFEIGRIYLRRDGDLPEERRVLTIGSGAYASGAGWGSRVEVDFFAVKGVVEAALDRIGVPHVDWAPLEHPLFRRGHAAAIVLPGGRGQEPALLGGLGEVALAVRRAFDLAEPVFLAGFDLDRVFDAIVGVQPFRSLARFPAVYQDLAIVLPESAPSEDVRRAIVRAGRPLVVAADLFDEYRGEGIGPGRRSLAYRITYQSPDRTLNDREVAETHARIEDALARQFQAQIRGRS